MNKLLKIMMLGAFVTTGFAMEGDEVLGRLKDNYMTAKTELKNAEELATEIKEPELRKEIIEAARLTYILHTNKLLKILPVEGRIELLEEASGLANTAYSSQYKELLEQHKQNEEKYKVKEEKPEPNNSKYLEKVEESENPYNTFHDIVKNEEKTNKDSWKEYLKGQTGIEWKNKEQGQKDFKSFLYSADTETLGKFFKNGLAHFLNPSKKEEEKKK